MLRWCAPGRGFDSGASLGLVWDFSGTCLERFCKFLFVRVYRNCTDPVNSLNPCPADYRQSNKIS
jgi:hypothetical protein